MIELRPVINNEEYDKYIKEHKNGDLLQLTDWAKIKSDFWTSKRYFIYEDDNIIGAYQILLRSLPLGYKIGYISRGPVIDYDNYSKVDKIFNLIVKLARRDKCIRLTFDPKLRLEDNEGLVDFFIGKGCRHMGFNHEMKEIQPRCNMIMDIDKDYGDIVECMSKDTRRFFRAVEDFPISVEKIGENDWDIFYDIMTESAKRNGITIRSKDYLKNIYETFGEDASINIAYLDIEKTIAYIDRSIDKIEKELVKIRKKSGDGNSENVKNKENKIEEHKRNKENFKRMADEGERKIPLATSLDIFCNEHAYYLYAGSSNDYRIYRPVVCLISENIKVAKRKGAKKYDLGGVSGETDPGKDDYAGLYEFKKRLGAELVEYVGEFEVPIYKTVNVALNKAIELKQKLAKRNGKKT